MTLRTLNEDEWEVLTLLRDRVTKGRNSYGPLVIDGDRRDFCTETLEEVLDAMVYLAIWMIQTRRASGSATETR